MRRYQNKWVRGGALQDKKRRWRKLCATLRKGRYAGQLLGVWVFELGCRELLVLREHRVIRRIVVLWKNLVGAGMSRLCAWRWILFLVESVVLLMS